LSACKRKGEKLSAQNIVFVGAGSAGSGIAELIISAMIAEGLEDAKARARVFMVDRHGLLTEGMAGLVDFQENLTQPRAVFADWQLDEGNDYPSLLDVIRNVDAGVLIGVSGKPGLFTEQVIRQMHAGCPRPIILPLSNPSRLVEAHPQLVLEWTNGEAIVATGSPFHEVEFNGQHVEVSQCNNSYIFPGVGLGVISCKASRITDEMLMVASMTLAELAAESDTQSGAILPALTTLPQISRKIAFAVARTAQEQGYALATSEEDLRVYIERNFWTPEYREYRRVAMRAR
jgi:malate dehydrogenase (oxaloacetate-decarboxylating)